MRFEGILKGYLKAVATCSTGLVAGGSSIGKGEGNRNRGLVQIGLVGSSFRSFSGPRNWTFKHYYLVLCWSLQVWALYSQLYTRVRVCSVVLQVSISLFWDSLKLGGPLYFADKEMVYSQASNLLIKYNNMNRINYVSESIWPNS